MLIYWPKLSTWRPLVDGRTDWILWEVVFGKMHPSRQNRKSFSPAWWFEVEL